MTIWTFVALAGLILWAWLCPVLIVAGIGVLLKRKGRGKAKQWQAKG